MSEVLTIAHRGASAYEPENTLRPLERALELSADLVEVDVRLSRDGKVVVIHDERVDRTTNGRGYVKDMTLNHLRPLDAGSGEKIPTMREVLNLVKGRAGLVVEIKVPEVVKKVVQTVQEEEMVREVLISSFYHPAVRKVKELNSDVKAGVIFSSRPVKP